MQTKFNMRKGYRNTNVVFKKMSHSNGMQWFLFWLLSSFFTS